MRRPGRRLSACRRATIEFAIALGRCGPRTVESGYALERNCGDGERGELGLDIHVWREAQEDDVRAEAGLDLTEDVAVASG